MRNQLNLIIVKKFKPDYKKATKTTKSQILNQLQELTKMDRKYLIKLMNNKRALEFIKPPGRPQIYNEEVYEHIRHLYSQMERISPKRMKVAIPLWLPFYENHFGNLNDEIRRQLLKVSSSTIGRILKSFKDQQRGKSTTRVNHKLKNLIPLKRLDEVVTKPGTVQADTVAHCGGFISTLTVTDIFTGWTENRACWTKKI